MPVRVAVTAEGRRGGCWPTEDQTLLLRAALLSGVPAIEAYHAWRGRVTLDRLDRGSLRLVPLLAWNLDRHEIHDQAGAWMNGVRRDARAHNAVLMTRLESVLGDLARAGLDTMILKGAALLALYYPDPGLRPMSDLDVLVRTSQIGAAMALLCRSGWTAAVEAPTRVVPVSHALMFHDADGTRLDLHWHVLWECCGPDADDELWAAAVPATVARAPTRVLCPADQLLHACAHGVAWNPVPPLRWAADAMLVLRAAGPGLAWGRVAAQARRLQLVLPLRAALTFLRNALDAPVPEEVLATLRVAPVSMLERLEYRARVRPWSRAGALPRQVCHYVRLSRANGRRPGLVGFSRYLQQLHGLARLRDLPPELWRLFRRPPAARRPGPPG